jgi:hypothetical protein
VGIAYQIALMRVFSVAQWHHFAYMIIGMAMLGFGAAGAALAVFRPRLRGHERTWLRTAAALLPLGLCGCYVLSQKIPFETFQLVAQPRQLGYLLALYVVLSVPFFLVSTCTTLAFFLEPASIARLYFFTMLGSGLGAAGVVGLLYAAHPDVLPYWLSVAASLAHLLLVRGARWGRLRGYGLLCLFAAIAVMGRLEPVRVSEYKGLSYARLLPDARVIEERCSPLSVITAVRSALIRETPGQIGNYSVSRLGPLPAQVGLYFDAGSVSPVNEFRDGSLDRFTYLDYVTSALAYRLIERPRALVLGAGGGTDILSALWHGAAHVTAVEVDPSVHFMMRHSLQAFSGGLYERGDVTAVLAEGRGFLQAHPETFDLVHLPLFGAFNAAAAGVYALNESYLYTRESFDLYLSRLSDRGVLSVNCWLKIPPCEAIKLFATAAEACARFGIADPGRHLAFVRSWNNATILVTRSPFTENQVEAVRRFCMDRGFDLCYCPGICAEETNRFTVLDREVYYEAALAILSPEREAFYRAYPFYVRPATDDRPYFFRFFKWSAAPLLVRTMGMEWAPFVEWGYLALVATVAQSLFASAAFILLPVAVLARRPAGRGVKRWALVYFAGLGGAYMFLEIAAIQRFMLFLAYPVYAVAVVLTAFLVFSSLGSLFAGRFPDRPVPLVAWAVAGIAVPAALYLAGLSWVFAAGAGWPDTVKIAVSILLLAPMAFCMGIPFPTGLQLISNRAEPLVPWVWGINGCASVLGASLATLTAVHLGIRAAAGLAVLLYTVAAVALQRLSKRWKDPCP